MIEFKLKDRRLRLIDGVFYSRAIMRGKETKKEKWNKMSFCDNTGYLICGLSLNKVKYWFLQHRLVWYAHHQEWDIFDSSMNNFIDHINQNKKDNRLCNLRKATHAENQQNTDCKGCYFIEARNKWRAQIKLNGKDKYLGYYDTYEEGHEEYLKAKRELHAFFVEDE